MQVFHRRKLCVNTKDTLIPNLFEIQRPNLIPVWVNKVQVYYGKQSFSSVHLGLDHLRLEPCVTRSAAQQANTYVSAGSTYIWIPALDGNKQVCSSSMFGVGRAGSGWSFCWKAPVGLVFLHMLTAKIMLKLSLKLVWVEHNLQTQFQLECLGALGSLAVHCLFSCIPISCGWALSVLCLLFAWFKTRDETIAKKILAHFLCVTATL